MIQNFYCPDCGSYYELEDGEIIYYDDFVPIPIKENADERECGCQERKCT